MKKLPFGTQNPHQNQRSNRNPSNGDSWTINYYSSPTELWNLSQKQFIQGWRVTKKKVLNDPATELLDTNGRVVAKRNVPENRKILVDLLYRVSPPDPTNEKRCIGALILHVPHRSP